MSAPFVEITHSEEFSASHRLHDPRLTPEENVQLYGICNNVNGHGHNYELEVTVGGPVGASGMVMNLTDLMVLLRERVLPKVDHLHLNMDVPFLDGVIPTAENIVVALWNEIERELKRFETARLVRIRLFESRSNWVEYRGSNE